MEAKLSKEQRKIVKSVDSIMEGIRGVIPSDMSKAQVAAIMNLYLEIHY